MTKFKYLDTDYIPTENDIEVIADMIPTKKGREKWRKRNKHIATKPIPTELFPTLANLMIEDGIRFVLDDEGYQWFHEEYKVTTTAIREVWGLTEHQWRRFMRWCYKGWPV
tara:strand:- start:1397 stop:1729 length:333 start_codon:yes stop_codon:yes gene_type:complete